MQNLQNIPGETDLDTGFPIEITPSEEKEEKDQGENDLPSPPDKLPAAPIEEPDADKPPINENPREPQRIMS